MPIHDQAHSSSSLNPASCVKHWSLTLNYVMGSICRTYFCLLPVKMFYFFLKAQFVVEVFLQAFFLTFLLHFSRILSFNSWIYSVKYLPRNPFCYHKITSVTFKQFWYWFKQNIFFQNKKLVEINPMKWKKILIYFTELFFFFLTSQNNFLTLLKGAEFSIFNCTKKPSS